MPQELTQDQINQLLQGISIPPQPQIMVDLQMEQLSPECSISRISELICQDVGLSGSILKTVNSPFYGLTNKITSVTQACTLLGINSIVNIVNALSIRGALSDENIVALNRFWDSATDVAMACATIARQLGFSSDEAYTLGLFHNCGIPLLLMRFDNIDDTLCTAYANESSRIIDIENERWKTNHAVVGYYVAKSWNLPRYLCEAIADHHNAVAIFKDPDYPQSEKKNLIAVLKIAEHICGLPLVLGNQRRDIEWEQLQEPILSYIGLVQDDLLTIREFCQEQGIGDHGFFAG